MHWTGRTDPVSREHSAAYRETRVDFGGLSPEGTTRLGCRLYPFSAPLLSPAMKSFCNTKNKMVIGIRLSNVPAIKGP